MKQITTKKPKPIRYQSPAIICLMYTSDDLIKYNKQTQIPLWYKNWSQN